MTIPMARTAARLLERRRHAVVENAKAPVMLNQSSARDILRRIAQGETTAEAVVRACLERIAAREKVVAAWAYCNPELALAQARACDRAARRGALHGLPIGVKDNFDTADMPTEYGTPIWTGHRPDADAACVAILRAAGAVILGKAANSEFAAFHSGKTRNPRNLAHVPGGSSSGSAAAVADMMVPVALGTQTGGSIIRPAAFCGVVGFKPSYGIINRAGVKPAAESVDTVGAIARDVEDAAFVAAVLMGADAARFGSGLTRAPRIAVYRGPDWSKAEAPAAAMLDDAARRLAKAGATVREIDPPKVLAEADRAHMKVCGFEMARALAYEWSHYRDRISATLTPVLEDGWKCSLADYLSAQRVVQAARASMADALAEDDIWLTLSSTGEAPMGRDDRRFRVQQALDDLACADADAAVRPWALWIAARAPARRTLSGR